MFEKGTVKGYRLLKRGGLLKGKRGEGGQILDVPQARDVRIARPEEMEDHPGDERHLEGK